MVWNEVRQFLWAQWMQAPCLWLHIVHVWWQKPIPHAQVHTFQFWISWASHMSCGIINIHKSISSNCQQIECQKKLDKLSPCSKNNLQWLRCRLDITGMHVCYGLTNLMKSWNVDIDEAISRLHLGSTLESHLRNKPSTCDVYPQPLECWRLQCPTWSCNYAFRVGNNLLASPHKLHIKSNQMLVLKQLIQKCVWLKNSICKDRLRLKKFITRAFSVDLREKESTKRRMRGPV
jgi:hypothetical protein